MYTVETLKYPNTKEFTESLVEVIKNNSNIECKDGDMVMFDHIKNVEYNPETYEIEVTFDNDHVIFVSLHTGIKMHPKRLPNNN